MDGMKKGLYDSAKWLPIVAEKMRQVAKETGTLDKMSNNLDSSLARLQNSWDKFIKTLEKRGAADKLADLVDLLTEKINELSDELDNAESPLNKTISILGNLAKAFGQVFSIVFSQYTLIFIATGALVAFGMALNGLTVGGLLFNIGKGLGILVRTMMSVATATSLATVPLGVLVGLVALLALVIEDVYAWTQGKESFTGDLFGSYDENFNKFFDFIDEMKKKWDEATAEMKKMWDSFKATVSKPFDWLGKKWDDVSKGAGEMMNDMGIRTSIVANAPMVTGQQNKPAPTYQINGVTVIANDPQSFSKGLERETLKFPRGGYQ